MVKITTIVPLYNGQKYISKCLNSLTRQGLNDTEHEIIVVNDGSEDDGPLLVESFQRKKTNIKLVNKKNGGVSSARNMGIAMALGEYLHFMDADDVLLDNSYKFLIDEGHGADIIKFSSVTVDKRINKNEVINRFNSNPVWKYCVNTDEFVRTYGFPSFVWQCLYKRSLIQNERFQTFKMSEDVLFNVDLFCKFKNLTISVTTKVLYEYVVHDNSAMTTYSKLHLLDVIYNFYEIWKIIQFKRERIADWDEAFAKVQAGIQRQAITRLLSGAFSYSDIKSMVKDGYDISIFPLEQTQTGTEKCLSMLIQHPCFIWVLSPIYRYVFLKIIKPFVKRN